MRQQISVQIIEWERIRHHCLAHATDGDNTKSDEDEENLFATSKRL